MTTAETSTTTEAPAVRPMTDDDATDLIVELVDTKSLSGAERPAVDVFVRRAAVAGFHSEIDAAGNGLAWRRTDSSIPSEQQKTIVLLGHIDTVPGDIPVRLEDGVLHGRGSVDAKGPLASFLAAASRAELPDNVNLLVCAACGEEEESPGAHHLKTQLKPDACVIGEPSRLGRRHARLQGLGPHERDRHPRQRALGRARRFRLRLPHRLVATRPGTRARAQRRPRG